MVGEKTLRDLAAEAKANEKARAIKMYRSDFRDTNEDVRSTLLARMATAAMPCGFRSVA